MSVEHKQQSRAETAAALERFEIRYLIVRKQKAPESRYNVIYISKGKRSFYNKTK
jgi:hypothetical protein